jgi:hypothetical protein
VTDSWTFRAQVWLGGYSGDWYFVTLPTEVADEVEFRYSGPRRGFGAVRVRARIGRTTWETSMFPDGGLESYVLPVKKSVRDAEGLDAGSRVEVELTLVPY